MVPVALTLPPDASAADALRMVTVSPSMLAVTRNIAQLRVALRIDKTGAGRGKRRREPQVCDAAGDRSHRVVSVPEICAPRSARKRLASARGASPLIVISMPAPRKRHAALGGNRQSLRSAGRCRGKGDNPAAVAARSRPVERRNSGGFERRRPEPAARMLNDAAGLASLPVSLAVPERLPPRFWPGAAVLSTPSGKASSSTSSARSPPSSGTPPTSVARRPSGLVTDASTLSRLAVDVPLATTVTVFQTRIAQCGGGNLASLNVEVDARRLSSAPERCGAVYRAAQLEVGPHRVGDSERKRLDRNVKVERILDLARAATRPPPTSSARFSIVTFCPAPGCGKVRPVARRVYLEPDRYWTGREGSRHRPGSARL